MARKIEWKEFKPAVGFFREDGKVKPIVVKKPPRNKTIPIVKRVYDYRLRSQIPPMKAKPGTVHDIDNPDLVMERKYDGTFTHVIKNGSKVTMRGRNWKEDYSIKNPELAEAVSKIPTKQFVALAELTRFNKKTGKEVFLTALANPETKIGLESKLMFFDILFMGKENLMDEPLEARKRWLKRTVKPRKHLEIVETAVTMKEKKKLWAEMKKKKTEGAILKRKGSPYRSGQRHGDWLKLKIKPTSDVLVVGVTKGKAGGKRDGKFGALILADRDKKGKLRYIGKVGTGFNDKDLKLIEKKLSKHKRKTAPIGEDVKEVKYWVKPKMVVEVEHLRKTKNLKLRQPSFMRIRDDKDPSEV